MKIDFNYKFKALDGTIIPERPPEMEEVDGKQVEKKSPPFTLRTACVNVLIMRQADGATKEKELSGEEKLKRYQFATKIYKSTGLLDLQAEEISLLKKLIGRVYPPITAGQAWMVLDPHTEEK